MLLALVAVSVILFWVSSALYTRRRPGGKGHDRKLIVISTLAPVAVLLLWVVSGILPPSPLSGAIFFLGWLVFLLALAWFLLEMVVFLLVPIHRPQS
jgi:membrane-associated HD superfamily phosphohydrolase